MPFFGPKYITLPSSIYPASLLPLSHPHHYNPHAGNFGYRTHTQQIPHNISSQPHFPFAKLSKGTERTYLPYFLVAISDLCAYLLKRLQRVCRMRVGAFEERDQRGSPSTSTAGSGTARDMVDQGPSFDMVVIGCGGGPFETNLSA